MAIDAIVDPTDAECTRADAQGLRHGANQVEVGEVNIGHHGARAENEHERDDRRRDQNRERMLRAGARVSPARIATYSKPLSAPSAILLKMLRLKSEAAGSAHSIG